jgi:hypothetical protein
MFPTESTEHRRSIAKGWKLTFWKRLYGGLPSGLVAKRKIEFDE